MHDDACEHEPAEVEREHVVQLLVEISVVADYPESADYHEMAQSAAERAQEALSLRFSPGIEIDAITTMSAVEL